MEVVKDMEMTVSEWALITKEKCKLKQLKNAAEEYAIYDKTRTVTLLATGDYAIPVTVAALTIFYTRQTHPPSLDDPCGDTVQLTTPPFSGCQLSNRVNCLNNRKLLKHSKQDSLTVMGDAVRQLGLNHGLTQSEASELVTHHLPNTWIRHGDLLVLSKVIFDHHLWQTVIESCTGTDIWEELGKAMKCTRIILQEKISDDGYRSPINHLVLGQDGWVTHTDNGVHYVFDAVRTMFSQGNITEKIRMAGLDCTEETIVDLFAGIGYFTLPLLVHGKARLVYACEWSPAAIEGLSRGLIKNRVNGRCEILKGDNRKVAPKGVADRVLLGLIPSSEASWVTGCQCIRPDKGGWIHIHGNVTTTQTPHNPSLMAAQHSNEKDDLMDNRTLCQSTTVDAGITDTFKADQSLEYGSLSSGARSSSSNGDSEPTSEMMSSLYDWAESVRTSISRIFNEQLYPPVSGCSIDSFPIRPDHQNQTRSAVSWNVMIGHVECVKSYAPRVYHAVVDLHCTPS